MLTSPGLWRTRKLEIHMNGMGVTRRLLTILALKTRVPVSQFQVDDVAGCKILRYERSKSWNRSDSETKGDGTASGGFSGRSS